MSKNSKNFLTGKFIKRYKRFFVDVQLDSKKIVTAHCPNTGSMMGLLEKDNLVYLTEADDPNRKLKFTLEVIQSNGAMVGVNTHRANRIVEEAISNGKISELGKIVSFKREVKYGQNSRIDFLVQTIHVAMHWMCRYLETIKAFENVSTKSLSTNQWT